MMNTNRSTTEERINNIGEGGINGTSVLRMRPPTAGSGSR